MGSLGAGEIVSTNNPIWLYPKMMGANPSERWGHSSCFFNGFLYIFGGCRGGVHFSDVLVCNLATMTWNILKTSGQGPGPGPRDSHTAVLVGHKMIVFGGTNGCKKVNDLHILDLLSREWTHPECHGNPPCARESHTANVVDEKLVIFGGSGEGEANYLNDLHILDLNKMQWSSPEIKGPVPAPRDSHSSVAVGNRLYVFGGDSGDRYQGDVCVLDMNSLVWSKLDVSPGASPPARAGHAAVGIGTKMYVLGGVGDKQYYSDIWVLDVLNSSWLRLDADLRRSQARFSHTATVTNLGVAVFGGCGEDERPLNELLVLQTDTPSSRVLWSHTCKDEETKMSQKKTENNLHKTIIVGDDNDSTVQEVEEFEFVPACSFRSTSDMSHSKKRRRNGNLELPGKNREADERSHSPSQPELVPSPVKKHTASFYPFSGAHHRMLRPNIYLSSDHPPNQQRNTIVSDAAYRSLLGAEVRGQVDGAFDSGYLMTATVDGKVFRGVLFPPALDVPRGTSHPIMSYPTRHHPIKVANNGDQNQTRRLSPESRGRASQLGKVDPRANRELQGVVLTLARPGSDQGRL